MEEFFCGTTTSEKGRCSEVEAGAGIKPTHGLLQSRALSLGYPASLMSIHFYAGQRVFIYSWNGHALPVSGHATSSNTPPARPHGVSLMFSLFGFPDVCRKLIDSGLWTTA